MSDWLLLQLADSAFPTGGFAHSGGLEASVQLGEVTSAADLVCFVEGSLWQAGFGAFPYLRSAHTDPDRMAEVDARCHAFLGNHIANAASRTQGRSFVATFAQIYGGELLVHLYERVRDRRIEGHYAPVFGACTKIVGVAIDEAQRLFLHLALRGTTSAAVRLGVVGPHEAQRIVHGLTPVLERVIQECGAITEDVAAQPSPVVDLFGTMHDRLYSRLFQS